MLERSELLLLPLPRGFPHTVQRLGHAFPDLRPARALLARVPLGPRPWLDHLRRRFPGFVRRLLRYYDGVLTSHPRASPASAIPLGQGSHAQTTAGILGCI